MTVRAPVSASHVRAPAPVPVSERQTRSTPGVKILVSGVAAVAAGVAVSLYSIVNTGTLYQ